MNGALIPVAPATPKPTMAQAWSGIAERANPLLINAPNTRTSAAWAASGAPDDGRQAYFRSSPTSLMLRFMMLYR